MPMLSALILSGALAVGQPPSSPGPEPPTDQVEVPPTPAPDRGLLMKSLQGSWAGVLLDDHRVSISGWTDGSFTASTDRIEQLPMGFNYRANQYLLQNNWLRVERTIDDQASTPTWGFRSDTILPGSDYRFTLARGLMNWQLTADNGHPNLYGIDPVQFYGEAYLPHVGEGLDLKLGRHFCQFGVESIDPTQNALGSHAYNFIYNPFTHTGLLTTLKLSDAWSVQSGLVTGADMFIAPGANPTYVGSVKWAPPAGPDSVLVSVIVGEGRYDETNAFNNPEVFDLVYSHKFSDRLTYTLDALYSFQNGFPGSGFVNVWGAVQYLTYQFTSQWAGTTRLEFFGDPQGWKTGFPGTYTAVTAGVTYKPAPYLWFRPEVRFDDNSVSRPFEGKPNLFTATIEVIARW
jgi:hypothetical protein